MFAFLLIVTHLLFVTSVPQLMVDNKKATNTAVYTGKMKKIKIKQIVRKEKQTRVAGN